MQVRRVRLLGERLTLRTDLSQEELDSIASYADEKMSRFMKASSADPKKQILLGVLHLTGELLEARVKMRDLDTEHSNNEETLKNLLKELDEI